MKFLTYKEDGYEVVGIASDDGSMVYSLPEIGISYFNMTDLVSRLTVEDFQTLTAFLKSPKGGKPYESIEKCSPIPCPQQDVICLGINYMQHAEEAARGQVPVLECAAWLNPHVLIVQSCSTKCWPCSPPAAKPRPA